MSYKDTEQERAYQREYRATHFEQFLSYQKEHRSTKTRQEAFARREAKKYLVELFGGACIGCGYNKSVAALHFDHIDPTDKIESVGRLLGNGRIKAAIEEAKKCQLLCANCHAEKTWPNA